MGNWKCSRYRYALAFCLALGFTACIMSSEVLAGGVYVGLGVDVPFPGVVVAPPVVAYSPPVVVEQPAPVVVRRAYPPVVYDTPVVVERHSSVYYSPPTYQYRSYYEGTGRSYYRERSRYWEADYGY